MAEQSDFFGHASGSAQASLFSDDRMQAPPQDFTPDPEAIRRRLTLVLDKARDAERMPWPEREARMWRTVFPNMTAWLPDEEGRQLRFAFAQEMERLGMAA